MSRSEQILIHLLNSWFVGTGFGELGQVQLIMVSAENNIVYWSVGALVNERGALFIGQLGRGRLKCNCSRQLISP